MTEKKASRRAAICLTAAAFAVMAFAVLKNIGYPLLWNDEGETAMYAERVLDFGYPKVSDGKNIVYCLELEDKMAGRRTVGGAYLGSGWGHFYFGAIGALAARAADAIAGRPGIESPPDPARESRSDRPRNADVYLKTALLRIPFALAGLAAVVLMVIAVAPLLAGGSAAGRGQKAESLGQSPSRLDPDKISGTLPDVSVTANFGKFLKPKISSASDSSGQADRRPSTRVWLFAAAVFAWQALSVPWALHMREMRYYSLVCLLLAWILFLAVRRHMGRMGPGRYGVLMFAALALLLVTFPVAVAGAAGILGIWEVVRFARRRSWREAAEGIAPLAAAGLAMGAYVVVFRTFEISRGFNEMFPWTIAKARHTADRMLALFFDYESLWVVMTALGLGTSVAIVSWARGRRKRKSTRADRASEAAGGTGAGSGPLIMERADRRLVGLAAVIAVYAGLHAAVVMRQPFPIAFSRYYIWLQPAAGLAMWLCLFALGGTIRTLGGKWVRRAAGGGLAGGLVLLAALTAGERVPVLKERIYELFHKNIGPMDYAVAFVRRTYPDPSRLVIATNYEECVLQYYLGSKVTVGFVGNNLEEDLRVVPDIIIGRKRPTYTNKPLMELMQRAEYRIRTLPIVDAVTNTVPEVGGGEVVHRFRTPRPGSDRQALEIRVKR